MPLPALPKAVFGFYSFIIRERKECIWQEHLHERGYLLDVQDEGSVKVVGGSKSRLGLEFLQGFRNFQERYF